MKKIILFRTIAIIIVLFNILNFFLMAASYTGIYVIESATLSDYAFYNFSNIDCMYNVIGSACDNRLIPAVVLLIVDLYLAFVLLFRTPKYGDYLVMPYKRIFITCGIGIFLHIFLLQFTIPSGSHDESYFDIIWKGMLWNTLWTIGYIVIIVFFAKIKKKQMTANDEVATRLNIKDVVALSILIELFLSFFYVSLVNRYRVSGTTSYGVRHTVIYGRLYFSQFMMMFKQDNHHNLPGVVEGYPYMIIPLILIFAQTIITLTKPKGKTIMIGVISLISIVVMTIGLCDMCDSIYAKYICKESRNFFSLVGIGYYFIIGLNIALLCSNLYPENNLETVIIGAKEMQDVIDFENEKKNEEKEDVTEEEKNKEEEKELDSE